VVRGGLESEPLATLLDHSLGNYAVDVFFALSGFLVVQSLSRDGDLLRFGVSRVLRICERTLEYSSSSSASSVYSQKSP
jgi:peptidoglycan/LPS O-acetylase OafA/YrhL